MNRRPSTISVLFSVAAAALILAATVTPHASSASVPALKAAFVFNFAMFSEWPSDALGPGRPIFVCVVGDSEVGGELKRAVAGRRIGDHPLVVSFLSPEQDLCVCHVLYVSGLSARRMTELLESLRGAPILTVSDLEHFAPLGGIAELYAAEGRMRFAVNVNSIDRSRLRLSSRLLSLAKIVHDRQHTADSTK